MGATEWIAARKFFNEAWPEHGDEVFLQETAVFLRLYEAFERHPAVTVPLLDFIFPVCRGAVDSGVSPDDISAILRGAGELIRLGRMAERSSTSEGGNRTNE